MQYIGGKTPLSRRSFVGKLAAGAAVAAATGAAGLGRAEALVNPLSAPGADGPLPPDGGVASAEPVPSARAAAVAPAPLGDVPDAAPPWELLSPLAEGSSLPHGWQVAELSEVIDGSCVLTLRNQRGRSHRVHLCGHDGKPEGLVYTDRIDLLVMNGGQGDLPTDEGLAQAVAEVAHALAANEGDRRQARVVAVLLPQRERVERFAVAARLR